MSDDPRAAWISIITEKRGALGALHTTETTGEPPKNPAEFREVFETLCEKYNQVRAQKLLAGFQRQFTSILAFTGHIDGAGSLSPPDTLTSLFLAYATALIETALQSAVRFRVPVVGFESGLRPYTRSIPSFGPELAQHFTVANVQAPLQRIYSEYIDCYCTMLTHFATTPPPLCFEPIQDRFDTATALFAQAKQDWELALKDANEAAERQRQQFASVPSVPNGNDGQSLNPQTTNVHFEFRKHLGHGTFGQVSEVKELTTKQLYARKMIRVRPDSRSQYVIEEQIKSEVSIMQKLRHPHIASVLFYVRDQDAFSIIMLPVAEYDLLHYLEEVCPSGGKDALRRLDSWFGCLITALTYAHQVKVKHHDIKPSNILIKNDQPYLADFGSAKDFSELETSASPADAVAGTPVYFAPEKPWGRSADVFALGCVFSEMLTVRSGKSLETYRTFRRQESAHHPLAFRENLPRVRDWVTELEESLREPLSRVCGWTLRMLNPTPDERCDSKDVKKGFRIMDESEMLFCNTCA